MNGEKLDHSTVDFVYNSMNAFFLSQTKINLVINDLNTDIITNSSRFTYNHVRCSFPIGRIKFVEI